MRTPDTEPFLEIVNETRADPDSFPRRAFFGYRFARLSFATTLPL